MTGQRKMLSISMRGNKAIVFTNRKKNAKST